MLRHIAVAGALLGLWPKRRQQGFRKMSRPPLNSPFLLGFDEIERALDRVARTASDGYPPYNIERIPRDDGAPERLRIALAVAGFTRDQLDVSLEENQLVIRGRQTEERERHRRSLKRR